MDASDKTSRRPLTRVLVAGGILAGVLVATVLMMALVTADDVPDRSDGDRSPDTTIAAPATERSTLEETAEILAAALAADPAVRAGDCASSARDIGAAAFDGPNRFVDVLALTELPCFQMVAFGMLDAARGSSFTDGQLSTMLDHCAIQVDGGALRTLCPPALAAALQVREPADAFARCAELPGDGSEFFAAPSVACASMYVNFRLGLQRQPSALADEIVELCAGQPLAVLDLCASSAASIFLLPVIGLVADSPTAKMQAGLDLLPAALERCRQLARSSTCERYTLDVLARLSMLGDLDSDLRTRVCDAFPAAVRNDCLTRRIRDEFAPFP